MRNYTLIPDAVVDRYHQDPVFHTLVDSLRYQLSTTQFTTGELRQAVLLAATIHEYENIRPIYVIKSPLGILHYEDMT